MMKKVYGVTQINRYIRNMFAQDFVLHQVCVKGEVSNCKYHSSGHIYFTLKENNSAISAIMFAGNRGGLSGTADIRYMQKKLHLPVQGIYMPDFFN